jgi:hypothetical protein
MLYAYVYRIISTMNFLRHFIFWVCSVLILILLSICFTLITFKVLTTEPFTIKKWLTQSNTYSEIVPFAMSGSNQTNDVSGIPKEAITSSLETALPASFLQTQTEKAIDNTYKWLDGSTSQLQFSIPFPDRKALFEKTLREKIIAYYKDNAPCLDDTMTAIDISICGISHPETDNIIHSVVEQVATQLGIFEEPFTQNSLSSSLQNDTKNTPQAWQRQSLYILLIIIGIGLAFASIYFISDDKIKTFMRFSQMLFFTTFLTVISLCLTIYASDSINAVNIDTTSPIPSFIYRLIGLSLHDVSTVLLYLYGPVTLASLICWMILRNKLRARTLLEKATIISSPPSTRLSSQTEFSSSSELPKS